MYRLLYADAKGCMFDHGLTAVGRTGHQLTEILDEDVIEMPSGASLVLVPDSTPVGMDQRGNLQLLTQVPGQGEPVFAVGALLPQGYTRNLLPGYQRQASKPLPLFGYTAVAWRGGKVYVAATRTDQPRLWDPANYNSDNLPDLVHQRLKNSPHNRILNQLAHCALEYSCYTAQNIFYTRWEGGLPLSPKCNARCLGCISLQPAECCPSPQARLSFRPTTTEAVEVALHHLQHAPQGIISFGQGCEGEPSLAYQDIAQVIAKSRQKTSQGTINMNSNAGYTKGVEKICAAGLDSLRVSLISANKHIYNAYYRPRDYQLADVASSIKIARANNVYVSLNLLVLPGLNDRQGEIQTLIDFIQTNGVNKVQLRNLNIDPDYLWSQLNLSDKSRSAVKKLGPILGINTLIQALQDIPGLEVGNFSRPVCK